MILTHWHLVAALVLSFVAAVFDARKGHIPNALCFVPMFLAPWVHALAAIKAGMTSQEALYEGGFSLTGIVICALVPLVLYRQNAIGGGDVKLLAALGALGQVSLGIEMQLYAFVFAVVVAPAQLAYQGKLGQSLKNTGLLLSNSFMPKDKRKTIDAETLTWFRFGPCIFLGVALTTFVHWSDRP